MEQEFVIYDQGLALKELGFDEPCFAAYSGDEDNSSLFIYWNDLVNMSELFISQDNCEKFDYECLAPTFSQAFKWFRDNHQLFYTIETNCSQLSFEWGFDYTIFDKENDKWLSTEPQNCPPGETTYVTYEEAESACIDKLIEIVKNR